MDKFEFYNFIRPDFIMGCTFESQFRTIRDQMLIYMVDICEKVYSRK